MALWIGAGKVAELEPRTSPRHAYQPGAEPEAIRTPVVAAIPVVVPAIPIVVAAVVVPVAAAVAVSSVVVPPSVVVVDLDDAGDESVTGAAVATPTGVRTRAVVRNALASTFFGSMMIHLEKKFRRYRRRYSRCRGRIKSDDASRTAPTLTVRSSGRSGFDDHERVAGNQHCGPGAIDDWLVPPENRAAAGGDCHRIASEIAHHANHAAMHHDPAFILVVGHLEVLQPGVGQFDPVASQFEKLPVALE